MVAPFVNANLDVIGCHITWFDADRLPKFRLIVGTHSRDDESRNLLCSIRDIVVRQIMQITVEAGAPVVIGETEKPQR